MNLTEFSQELGSGNFGDARLNRRAQHMAQQLAQYPSFSIPSACKSRADVEGAYRFFNNSSITPERILAPHVEATYQRMATVDYALLVQDTTEIDLTRPQQQVHGAGPMDCETRRGAFFHPMIAFDEKGVPLGLVGQESWTRPEISRASKAAKCKSRHQRPIEEKESYRWLRGVQYAEQAAAACSETTCVCVGDSESDIYAVFAAAATSGQKNLHFLVRAGQNRNTTEEQDWLEQVRQTEKIGEQTISIRARTAKTNTAKSARSRSREARIAELETRKTTLELRRPGNCSREHPECLRVNLVLCEEPNPPQDSDPISWLLVTTLPIASESDVQRVISSYCTRWQIEVFFRTLKSGCKVERRRFETLDRVLNCVTFFSVIAWRVMYICHLGRECPELPCEVMLEPSEWKSVYSVLDKPLPPEGCPSLNEVVRAIATLGGFMNRPRDHPGPQTLWIGLQRTYDLSNAWNTFGPGSKNF